jgi:hypothetical protein
MKLDRDQQGPGHPEAQKIYNYFKWLRGRGTNFSAAAVFPFVPGGKICRGPGAKPPAVIASWEYGLY